jgi:Fe-S-cluster-containing hydrogenase component 2
MPAFHCPLGAVYYDDEPCIDCGLCQARTPGEMVEASKRMREYIRAHGKWLSAGKEEPAKAP